MGTSRKEWPWAAWVVVGTYLLYGIVEQVLLLAQIKLRAGKYSNSISFGKPLLK